MEPFDVSVGAGNLALENGSVGFSSTLVSKTLSKFSTRLSDSHLAAVHCGSSGENDVTGKVKFAIEHLEIVNSSEHADFDSFGNYKNLASASGRRLRHVII